MTAPEVLGIGAPVIDYIVDVPEEFIEELTGRKGGMVIVDYQTFSSMLHLSNQKPHLFLGGSAANTIRGLANFGHSCAFLGKIGRDAAGNKFLNGMKALGIKTNFLIHSDTPTAQVICFITPDKERTMRAYLGASQEITKGDLHKHMFHGIKHLHLEGYILLNPLVARRAVELAKEAGAKVSLDLGSFEVVESNRELVIEFLTHYVNVVFANRDEVKMLTRLDPEKGCNVMRDICETVVVLLGKEGCWVGQQIGQARCPAFPVHEPLDTTGAGDLFASGFLHGYLKGYPLEECARFGALAGAAVVKVRGVEIPPHEWIMLKNLVSGKVPLL